MTKRIKGNIAPAALLACLACTTGYANSIVTTPAGLAPGTQYQLVFYTLDTFTATSTSISTYNTDVTNEAALNPTLAAFDAATGVTWTDIGTTASINANVNAPAVGLVFDLEGNMVASPTHLLYSGSLLGNGIDYDEDGDFSGVQTESVPVWTGSEASGIAFPSEQLGSASGVAGGFAGFSDSVWSTIENSPSNSDHHLYALSSVITVPSAAPEPGTVAQLGLGLVLLAVGASGRIRVRRDKRGF